MGLQARLFLDIRPLPLPSSFWARPFRAAFWASPFLAGAALILSTML